MVRVRSGEALLVPLGLQGIPFLMPVTVDNGYLVLAAIWLLVEPGFFFDFLSNQGEESPFLIERSHGRGL